MSDYQGYSFQCSEPLEPNDRAHPERFQSAIPIRVSRFSDSIQEAAEKARETLVTKLEMSSGTFASSGTIIPQGHIVSWAFPECPSFWIPFLTELMEFAFVFDDFIDSLDKKSQDQILADTLFAMSTGTTGTPQTKFKFIPEAKEMISRHLDIPDQGAFLMEMKDAFTAQTAHIGRDMSFNEYKEFKINHSGARLMTNAIARFKGQRVSKQEMDSVAYFIDKFLLSSSLLNDLYSFHKEFDDHATKGTVDTIGNAMVLLMSSYGYTEDEASSILKQEIQTLEAQGLEQFKSWQNLYSIEPNALAGHVFTVVYMIGGMNYWMSNSDRYFRSDLQTTAEDRTKLVADGPVLRRLENYPPPLNKSDDSAAASLDHMSQAPGLKSNSIPTDVSRMLSSPTLPGLSEHGKFATGINGQFQKGDSEKLCMAPYDYISSLPGKGTIAKLVDAGQTWLNVPEESAKTIKKFTVIIFNSSLMLDDIQDDSVKRRGMPATHIMHGIGQTVNCVTYMGFKAFKICEELSHPDACRQVLFDEMEALLYGQALELYWKFHRQCPSMDEYLVMIDNKTGGFFRLVMRLMVAESTSSVSHADRLAHFATILGRFYQIRDDYQNLVSEEYTATKGFCDDLAEGKFSIMLIHTLQNSPTADRIRGLIFGGARVGMPEEIKSYILSEMRAAGSLDYTYRIVSELYGTLLVLLDELEASIGKNDLLRNLVVFLKV